MMKVAHLTSAHSRYDTRIFRKECRSLAAAGFDVTLIVADGQGDECCEGVSIVDVGRPRGRLGRMTETVNKVYAAAVQVDADLYHFHDPEILRIAKKLNGLRKGEAKVIYDVHEDYAKDIRVKPYLPAPLGSIVASTFGLFQRHVVRNIDGVVVVTNAQVSSFQQYAKCCAVVPNFVDLSRFPERSVDFDCGRILHAGSLSEARGLHEMIRLANKLAPRGKVVLAGPLHQPAAGIEFGKAHYMGVLDEVELLKEYMRSNIGLILYKPISQYGMATAVKVYEYMAAGMPVIVPDHGDWPALMEQAKCGLVVNVDDTEQQVEAVTYLLSNPERAREMGRNGRVYALAHASWDAAFKNMTSMYQKFY
ncbi:glycosyltransferase family 4 protein [Frateuria sp. Soil773]|uniref:glycosyltransferase family 4 protein n=1 Tax=Frateuria sp. Soil773 TaxID=1736407 RepID=UPI0009EA1B59|nr:glycosyltransferase family 4 protein [Frateuria sp. Soil773]